MDLRRCSVDPLLLVALVATLAAASGGSEHATCGSKNTVDVQEESQQALLQRRSKATNEQRRHATLEECVPSCQNCGKSARPGKPCLPPADGGWPYVTNTEWSTELGERILKAVTGDVQEKDCGGFHLYGDHVFCLNAMKETNAIALSYGIEERDRWSEKMSNLFHVSPRLYDCFQDPSESPPMAKTAPNGVGAGACTDDDGNFNDGTACYEMPYESNRICLRASAASINGRDYETLESHLEDRGPLSTYVKMDVEGSEWGVLEDLLKNPELQNKIRTLDMEVHFGLTGEDGEDWKVAPEQELRSQVKILEHLSKVFHVTGSTLEVAREGWNGCEFSACAEPDVHTADGFPVVQLAVSFVNRKLLP